MIVSVEEGMSVVVSQKRCTHTCNIISEQRVDAYSPTICTGARWYRSQCRQKWWSVSYVLQKTWYTQLETDMCSPTKVPGLPASQFASSQVAAVVFSSPTAKLPNWFVIRLWRYMNMQCFLLQPMSTAQHIAHFSVKPISSWRQELSASTPLNIVFTPHACDWAARLWRVEYWRWRSFQLLQCPHGPHAATV